MTNAVNPAAPADEPTASQAAVASAIVEFGPYRLLQRLGEGGMGEVWLGEQTRPLRRQIAIKLIKPGMDTARVIARFEAERQALAFMDHPGVAQVFDAGATPEGRPFFVMEYVRGEAVTTYCQRHLLCTRARLGLFLLICEGVQHAHQKGVIHRDLKPSNILVTEHGDRPYPKIIDFGLAKATTQHLSEHMLFTEIGTIVGTPEYMSPEQAESGVFDIDTRADIYSLGVILYELLTDVLPIDPKALRLNRQEAIRRILREVEPPRPSTRMMSIASAQLERDERRRSLNLAKELKGDLDWITMRAIEKDRSRRYGSVAELGADVQRYLDHLPVLAGPPKVSYRIHKFVQRNRIAAFAAFALLVIILGFAASMGIQARRVARERDRANREAAAARQVSQFLIGLFTVNDPSEARGNTLTAREILDKGARDVELTLSAQPEIQGRLQATIGGVYTGLGLYSAAEPLLKQALANEERTLGNNDPDTLSTASALAGVYWYEGRYGEAERLYNSVLEGRGRVLGVGHPDTLRTSYDLASVYAKQQRWAEAVRISLSTLAQQRTLLGAEHPDTLNSINNLASYYFEQQRYEQAEPLYAEVVAASKKTLGNDHPDTLMAMSNLAVTNHKLGRYVEAEQLYVAVLQAHRRVFGEKHPFTAFTQFSFGSLRLAQRQFAEAESLLLAAVDTDTKQLGAHHPDTQKVITRLVELYTVWGKQSQVAAWRAQLNTVSP